MISSHKLLMEDNKLLLSHLPIAIQQEIENYNRLADHTKSIINTSQLTTREKHIFDRDIQMGLIMSDGVVNLTKLIDDGRVVFKTFIKRGSKNSYYLGLDDESVIKVKKSMWKGFDLPSKEEYAQKGNDRMDDAILDLDLAISNSISGWLDKKAPQITSKPLHQELISTYGIRVHKLPLKLADSITNYHKLYKQYKTDWRKQHDFIDYENLTDEELNLVRTFLDKKRQFKDGDKSFNELLATTELIRKGREGNAFILYIAGDKGHPVPEYIYRALLNAAPSPSARDKIDYSALFRQADAQLTKGLLDFLRSRSEHLAYYLSDTGQIPSNEAINERKRALYTTLDTLVPDLIELPICQQYQTKFIEGIAYQIACVSKSSETSYFDLIELQLDSKKLTTYKVRSYTFFIQDKQVQPLLAVYYDQKGNITQDMEVIRVMGGQAKDEQMEKKLLGELDNLFEGLVEWKMVFVTIPSNMELLLKQLQVLQKNN